MSGTDIIWGVVSGRICVGMSDDVCGAEDTCLYAVSCVADGVMGVVHSADGWCLCQRCCVLLLPVDHLYPQLFITE